MGLNLGGRALDLDTWLAKNGMETAELARIVGVSRFVIWKVKTGKPILPETAEKIYFVTGGSVKPASQPRGWVKGRSKKGVCARGNS